MLEVRPACRHAALGPLPEPSCSRPQLLPTRRVALASLVVSPVLLRDQAARAAERGLGAYIKKRRLDPLETYIPPVLAARAELVQLKELIVGGDLAGIRRQLRSGGFDGIRENVRAIGLYAAEEASQGAKAEAAVKAVFDALNDFDGALLQASRSSSAVDSDALRGKAGAAIEAFDGLLELVPAAAKRQAEEVLERIRSPPPVDIDPAAVPGNLKAIESL